MEFRIIHAILPVLLCTALSGLGNDEVSPVNRLVHTLSPTIQRDSEELRALRKSLGELPRLSPGHRGANAGFHSPFQPSRDTPLTLVIDLGKSYPIERLALFPVRGTFRGSLVEGYGFPERFSIDLATDQNFTEGTLHFDSASLSQPPRLDYSRQFVLREPHPARFIRLSVEKHWTREDGKFLSAFAELMAFSGSRNVALKAAVYGESFTSLPDWHKDHLVDGQTDLGLPVTREPSQSNGFLSEVQRSPEAEKWIQLELPELASIDEVVLYPAQPFDAPDQFGHGFPRRFRLLASKHGDFSSAHVLADFRDTPFPNPGNNPVRFTADEVSVRYVRLEVDELWHISQGVFAITLAEIKMFQGAKNLAEGARVTASDVFTGPVDKVWKPRFLVDGFSSQNRLLPLEEWLTQLHQRETIERRIETLTESVEARTDRLLALLLGSIIAIAISSFLLTAVVFARRRHAIAEQREELRARIARDLHDDLGSRLGGMRLISENLLQSKELPTELQTDLDLLHRSSGEATEAMRDIVWLLDSREETLSALRLQMRRLIPSMTGALPCEFTTASEPEAKVDSEFRREVLLAFRETLHNAVRHSGCRQIQCRVGGDSSQFWFEVQDDGLGFTEQVNNPGHGLANVRKRAETLAGEVAFESGQDRGTKVTFSVPLPRLQSRILR